MSLPPPLALTIPVRWCTTRSQVDPDGEFADYYGKSLSADEMLDRVSALITGWEKQRWWDNLLGREEPKKPLVGLSAEQIEAKRKSHEQQSKAKA